MIPTQLGQSSYYNQYMRSQRGSSPRHGGAGTNGGGSNGGGLRERLLTDRDSYLQHLEEQIDKVSSACLLADELKAKHQELHLRVREEYPFTHSFSPPTPSIIIILIVEY